MDSVSLWKTPKHVVRIDTLEELRDAYASQGGVVWIHWDLGNVVLDIGDPDPEHLREAPFLVRLLEDAFSPQEGDIASAIIQRRANFVGTRLVGGGLQCLDDNRERGALWMFDSQVPLLAYSIDRQATDEERAQTWRWALMEWNRIVAICAPNLLITLRNSDHAAVFGDAGRVVEAAEDDGRYSPSKWHWSDPSVHNAVVPWLPSGSDEIRSGDLLAAIARDCAELFEAVRAWVVAEAEEVEVATLVPTWGAEAIDEASLARRHGWLLQQATRVRAGVDWAHDSQPLPNSLLSARSGPSEAEARRRELLSALTAVRNNLRSSLDLVASANTAEQLKLTRREAARSSAFQSTIAFLTTILLAPGLIAAVFGAMPGLLENHPAQRFLMIAASMAVAAAASSLALRKVVRRAESKEGDQATSNAR